MKLSKGIAMVGVVWYNFSMYSISIMACKEREDNVPYFIEKLGEVPISIDYGEKGIWNNCKDSWLLHQNKDWHIVLQDDSIIPPDFNKHIENLIKKVGDQDYIISLYAGARLKNKIRMALNSGKDFVTHYSILNENALMMRTKHINQIVINYERQTNRGQKIL